MLKEQGDHREHRKFYGKDVSMRVSYVYRIDRESLTLTNQLRWIQLVVWVPKICEIVCGIIPLIDALALRAKCQ